MGNSFKTTSTEWSQAGMTTTTTTTATTMTTNEDGNDGDSESETAATSMTATTTTHNEANDDHNGDGTHDAAPNHPPTHRASRPSRASSSSTMRGSVGCQKVHVSTQSSCARICAWHLYLHTHTKRTQALSLTHLHTRAHEGCGATLRKSLAAITPSTK